MTQDVMANSLVYWVQDLYRGGFLENGSKIYAMTSEGSSRVVPSYGVVSSAKAALESHIRQLAMELAQTRKGITANTIRAGVTMTPALMKIPEHDMIIDVGDQAEPDRPDDHAAGRRQRDRGAVGRGHRLHQRRGDRRRRRRVHHGVVEAWLVGSSSSGRSTRTSSSPTERLPGPGETVIGGRFAQHHGGKGGNQAVAAARLGARTFFVGAVGDDAFGRAARAALEAEGVDVAGLLTLPDEATGVALIVVDEAGENSDRGRRRRERGARFGPGAGRAQEARAQAGGRRAGRPRDPDRRDPRGAPARPHRQGDDDPQPGPGRTVSSARRSSWRTS